MHTKILLFTLCFFTSIFCIAQDDFGIEETELETSTDITDDLIGYESDEVPQDQNRTISPEDEEKHRKQMDSIIAEMNARIKENGGFPGINEQWREQAQRERRERENRRKPWLILKVIAIVVAIGSFIYRKASE